MPSLDNVAGTGEPACQRGKLRDGCERVSADGAEWRSTGMLPGKPMNTPVQYIFEVQLGKPPVRHY